MNDLVVLFGACLLQESQTTLHIAFPLLQTRFFPYGTTNLSSSSRSILSRMTSKAPRSCETEPSVVNSGCPVA